MSGCLPGSSYDTEPGLQGTLFTWTESELSSDAPEPTVGSTGNTPAIPKTCWPQSLLTIISTSSITAVYCFLSGGN